jgi:hypothetical protein
LHVLELQPVPVIPLGVSGLWGSLFSRAPSKEKLLKRLRLFRKVRLAAGEPVPAGQVDMQTLRARVLALRGPKP